MTLHVIFAIDPGREGAIATLLDGEPGPMLDMPIMTVGKNVEVDARALWRFMRDIRAQHPGAHFSGCIERVRAMPAEGRKQGAQTSMNFGDNYGKPKAVLEVLGIRYSRADPASWKRHFDLLGKDKEAGRILAIKLYPRAMPDLKRKKDHNRADALLMARWHESTQGWARAA